MRHLRAISLIGMTIAFTVSVLIAQESPLLVKIKPADNNLQDFIRTQSIPVYLKTKSYHIIEVSNSHLAGLRAQGYWCEVIDHDPVQYQYFFLPYLQAAEQFSFKGQVLFQDAEGIFFKAAIEELRSTAIANWSVIKVRRIIPLPAPIYVLPRVYQVDPFIQSLVDQVSLDSIRATIRDLQNFKTRYSFTPECSLAANYLIKRFQNYSLIVEEDWYDNQGDRQRNIVAVKVGITNSDKEYIIGAHYDSHTFLDPYHNAPGADDNASGTAAVVECARILSQYGFPYTFKFIAFCGEEQWMIGSGHYAANAVATGENILAMINNDMIAYTSEGEHEDFEIISDYASEWVADVWFASAQTYTNLLVTKTIDPTDPSDHLPFWENAFIAIDCCEDDVNEIWGGSNPNYHTPGDTLGTLNLNFATEAVKMNVAGLASLQLLLIPVSGFQVSEPGTGTDLLLAWNNLTDVRVVGYRIYYGTTSRNYTAEIDAGNVTQYMVGGLQQGVQYYFAVAAYDTAGRVGLLSPEISAVPQAVPGAPTDLVATPYRFSIRLKWDANRELDLLGYNVYRRTTNQQWGRINLETILQESYIDTALTEAIHYWYVVTAVDTLLNESQYSNEAEMVPALLNQGILVVDETRDGNGNILNPTDVQVDQFYQDLLRYYHYTEWDVAVNGLPQIQDVLLYSTVIWYNDDLNDLKFNKAKDIFRNYLTAGGNLWVSGWRILSPGDFSTGTIESDYFHLTRVVENPTADFLGALGLLGYFDVQVDTSKIITSWNGKLPFGMIFEPRDSEIIFRFQSASANPVFDNQACGLRYPGMDYKIIISGFPLYYMNKDQASAVVQKVLADFNEITAVKELTNNIDQMTPNEFVLSQNYPNPFNLTTTIFYQLPEPAVVYLSIYNIYGQLVKTLVEGKRVPGSYSVNWDASGLSSGIYFIKLSANQFSKIRKCILIK